MSQSDLPNGTASDDSLSFEQGVDDIANLLGDPEEDTKETDAAETTDDELDESDLDVDPDETDEQAEEQDGSKDYSGGKFASDNANVKLEDGSVISVAELRRNNLFQKDYSQKTMAHAETVKAFEADYQRVNDFAKNLAEQREVLAALMSEYLPEEPAYVPYDPNDPLAALEYNAKKQAYDHAQQQIQSIRHQQQAYMQNTSAEQDAKAKQWVAEQNTLVMEAIPELKDDAKRAALFNDFREIGTNKYKLAPADFEQLVDHRYVQIFKDAVAYQKLLARKAAVPEKVQGKPPVMRGGARQDPKAVAQGNKEARSSRLKQTGSMRDGIAALMDLDL